MEIANRGVVRYGVAVRYFETALTESEHADVDHWLDTHPNDAIDHSTIAAHSLSVHATRPGRNEGVGTIAVRHPDRLLDALDEAVARLRDTPAGRVDRNSFHSMGGRQWH
jgi:hypothetical protein